jgi:hypothetical protein
LFRLPVLVKYRPYMPSGSGRPPFRATAASKSAAIHRSTKAPDSSTSISRLMLASASWAFRFCASLTEVAYSPWETIALTVTPSARFAFFR